MTPNGRGWGRGGGGHCRDQSPVRRLARRAPLSNWCSLLCPLGASGHSALPYTVGQAQQQGSGNVGQRAGFGAVDHVSQGPLRGGESWLFSGGGRVLRRVIRRRRTPPAGRPASALAMAARKDATTGATICCYAQLLLSDAHTDRGRADDREQAVAWPLSAPALSAPVCTLTAIARSLAAPAGAGHARAPANIPQAPGPRTLVAICTSTASGDAAARRLVDARLLLSPVERPSARQHGRCRCRRGRADRATSSKLDDITNNLE